MLQAKALGRSPAQLLRAPGMQGSGPGGRAAIPFAAGHPPPSPRAFAHDARRAASHQVARRAGDKAGGRGAQRQGRSGRWKVTASCHRPARNFEGDRERRHADYGQAEPAGEHARSPVSSSPKGREAGQHHTYLLFDHLGCGWSERGLELGPDPRDGVRQEKGNWRRPRSLRDHLSHLAKHTVPERCLPVRPSGT